MDDFDLPDGFAGGIIANARARRNKRARVTAVMDGVIRTHDDALGFIQSLAPGARVTLIPWARDPLSQARRYVISYKKHGNKVITTGDTYALPVLEQNLRQHILNDLLPAIVS